MLMLNCESQLVVVLVEPLCELQPQSRDRHRIPVPWSREPVLGYTIRRA
jgi:hypothetical protein